MAAELAPGRNLVIRGLASHRGRRRRRSSPRCPPRSALRLYAELAGRLAHDDQWPALYDFGIPASNTVPVAAATYYEDMYVDFELQVIVAADGAWR